MGGKPMDKDQTNSIISKIQNDGLTNLNINLTQNTRQFNIDTINNSHAYIYSVYDPGGGMGTIPNVGSNTFILIGLSAIVASNNLPLYGVQIAFGFGSDKIAVRHANYNTSGTAWGAWKYLTAS